MVCDLVCCGLLVRPLDFVSAFSLICFCVIYFCLVRFCAPCGASWRSTLASTSCRGSSGRHTNRAPVPHHRKGCSPRPVLLQRQCCGAQKSRPGPCSHRFPIWVHRENCG